MAHHEEPMDIDSSVCDFDNKENSLHHSNVLPRTPCTEKGYEELDVTDLNMKLRYSITPTSSPMSKSFTANCLDNRNYESGDNITIDNENGNLTKSLHSGMGKGDMVKLQTLPLQTLPTDQYMDSNRNPLRPLDSTVTVDNVTVSISVPENDENDEISCPSSSSSMAHTPEATTPTKEIPKAEGASPIIRGLKSVFNMFRPSQSPIPPTEDENAMKQEMLSPPVINSPETPGSRPLSVLASTPLAAHKTKDALSKRNSPNRDSLVFNEDLEKELQWKDETTILFSDERIPIHKLFFTQQKPENSKNEVIDQKKLVTDNLDASVEYMDISCNDRTMTETQPNQSQNISEVNIASESDNEFLDCESTFTKNESQAEISFKSQEDNFDANLSAGKLKLQNEEHQNVTEESNATVSVNSIDLSIASTETMTGDAATFETVPEPVKAEDVIIDEEFEVKQVSCSVEKNENILECAMLPEIKSEMPLDNVTTDILQENPLAEGNLDLGNGIVIASVDKDDNVDHVLNTVNVDDSKCDVITQSDVQLSNVLDVTDTILTPDLGISTLSQIPLIVDPRVLLFNIPSQTPGVPAQTFTDKVDAHVVLDTLPADIPLPDDDVENVVPATVIHHENTVVTDEAICLNQISQINSNAVDQTFIRDVDESQTNEDIRVKCRVSELMESDLPANVTVEEDSPNVSLNLLHQLGNEDHNIFEIDPVSISREDSDKAIVKPKDNELREQLMNVDKELDLVNITCVPEVEAMVGDLTKESLEPCIPGDEDVGCATNNISIEKPIELNVSKHSAEGELMDQINNISVKVDKNVANGSACILKLDVIVSELTTESPQQGGSDNAEKIEQDTVTEKQNSQSITSDTTEEILEISTNRRFAGGLILSDSDIENKILQTPVTTREVKDVIIEKEEEVGTVQSNDWDNVGVNQVPQLLSPSNVESKLATIADGVNVVVDINNTMKLDLSERKHAGEDISKGTIDDIISEEIAMEVDVETENGTGIKTPTNETINSDSVTITKTDKLAEDLKELQETNQSEVVMKPIEEITPVEPVLSSNDVTEFASTVEESKTDIVSEITQVDSNTTNEVETSVKVQLLSNEMANNIEAKPESKDEEVIVSESTSPFVSVTAEELSSGVNSIENFEEIERQVALESRIEPSPPPSSPKIVSKGYNFNFDEIDDPFATKTKIRLSPPPSTSPNQSFDQYDQKPELPKKDVNRRRSEPEKRRPTVCNKKGNSTFAAPSVASKKTAGKPKLPTISNDTSKLDCSKEHNSVVDVINSIIPEEKDIPVLSDKKIDETIIDNVSNGDLNVASDILKNDTHSILQKSTEKMLNEEIASPIDPVTKNQEAKTMPSSEQYTNVSPPSSSNEGMAKNVFNLPEIDDMNFNPFATKSKIRQSPPPGLGIDDSFGNKSSNVVSSHPVNITVNIDATEQLPIVDNNSENKFSTSLEEKDCVNTSNSSKATDDKDATIRTIHTEDEDTIEGPFLDVEDLYDDKCSEFDCDNADMMQFSGLPTQGNDEDGELFIDAEAFEFLLNQNKTNMVADSGKESLFLKFDPLFAKRLSSDGVVAALKKVQIKQSTPTKKSKPPSDATFIQKSPVAGPSTLDETHNIDVNDFTEESNDDFNVTVSKPMMVVNPAVNPVVSPRNKTITPVRSNRRSLTFTSPAIAVIDRLLSMSANNSVLGNESVAEVNREQREADLVLTQLRELLADKEINVYNLRSESKELKDRLASIESQMKTLESTSQERLKKINDLTKTVNEKSDMNNRMRSVVEEYERTIASLIAETEQDKKRHAEERIQLMQERDEQANHLASMEVSFSDLHSKYEKTKHVILGFKANEESYRKSIQEFQENLVKMQTNYESLKQHATSKLNHANDELQKMNRVHEAEVVKLKAMIKRKELDITSLEETLSQKTKANEELTAICDELINSRLN